MLILTWNSRQLVKVSALCVSQYQVYMYTIALQLTPPSHSILPHHLSHPTSPPDPSYLTDPPSKPTPKPRTKPKPHQSHSPRTVTQEQRHPFPATPRQGMGPPAMPQVSLDELKSSKVLNSRRTTCTGPQGM